MCLGVPGRVIAIDEATVGAMTMGRVDFDGIVKQICLACVPDVRVGEYVVVHVGFAISKIDEAEALQVFEYLRSIDELSELEVPQPHGATT